VDESQMAVADEPDDDSHRMMAIFKQESQKGDKGPDVPRAQRSAGIWQRAEDRNRHTAMVYDSEACGIRKRSREL